MHASYPSHLTSQPLVTWKQVGIEALRERLEPLWRLAAFTRRMRRDQATTSVTVLLKNATGLKAADRGTFARAGKSDPYAILDLGGQTARSQTVMKTTDPTWNERFSFDT